MSVSEEGKGPFSREEYERRHKALQKKYDKVEAKYDTFSRRVYRILALMAIGILLTGGFSAYLLHENKQRTQDINDSLVTNCKENGNPLRAAVRKFGTTLIAKTENDITQSKTFEQSGTYSEIFPTYPPDKLHKLLVKSRGEERDEIVALKKARGKARPANCEARFRHP